MTRFIFIALLVAAMILSFGCGSKQNPLSPAPLSPLTSQTAANSGEKAVWGIWQVTLDPGNLQFEIVPLRGVEYTVDVVAFMQPPKGSNSNLHISITDLTDWVTEGRMGVEVGFVHPFPGYDQFVGFDVMGVVIGSGSLISGYDPGAVYSNGIDETIVENPDGYTRWFNPTEFVPDGTILRNVPGNLGTQDLSILDATVNGYKYFADGLASDDNLFDFLQDPLNVDNRGAYLPGSYNTREYHLKFPIVGGSPKLVFQYAVVANWVLPDKGATGDPDVIDIPGDYPSSANTPESFFCNVVDNSNLYYNLTTAGGEIQLNLEVFDWAGKFIPGSIPSEISKIVVESQNSLVPGGFAEFDTSSLTILPGSTSVSSVFMVDIPGCLPDAVENQEVLITIEQANGAFAPNPSLPPVVPGPLKSYVRATLSVEGEPPGPDFMVVDPNGGEKVPMTLSYEIKWNTGNTPSDTVTIEYSKDDFVSDIILIVSGATNLGSYTWDPVPIDPTDTAKIRVTEDPPGSETDMSDNYFSIAAPVWFEFEPAVKVQDAGVTWHPSWPYSPKDEFSPAIAEDNEGEINVTYYHQETNENYTSDTNVKSFDGIAWNGIANCFGTVVIMGDPWCTRGDFLKTAPNNIGSVYASIIHFPVPMPFWCTSVDRMVLPEYNDYSFDCGASVINNCEIGCDSLGHFYFFSDNVNPTLGITAKRCPHENKFGTAGGPDSMAGATIDVVADDGEISHVRSWGRVGEGMALAFYTTSGQVRIAKTTDAPANVTWDDSIVVFDGTGYEEIRDPGISIDSLGRAHVSFVGKETASGLYHLLYTRADTPDGPYMAPVIAATSTAPINDAHICFHEYNSYPVVGIVFETEAQIRSVLCARSDGTIFLPYQQMTDGSTTNADCDFWFVNSAAYAYDALIVYDQGDEPARRIVLHNANVGTL